MGSILQKICYLVYIKRKYLQQKKQPLVASLENIRIIRICLFLYILKLFICAAPVLDYCSEVWEMYNCAEIDKVQYIAERTFLNKFT